MSAPVLLTILAAIFAAPLLIIACAKLGNLRDRSAGDQEIRR